MSSKVMCDKWEDKATDVEWESKEEPINLQVYSDHRRGVLDSYPVIAVCEGCAVELGGDLGGCPGPAPTQVLFCEECGASTGSPSSPPRRPKG